MSRTRWRDLSSRQRSALLILGSVELVLTAAAARDLRHRPSSQIRGPKALWWPGIFVQPVGSIAYLTLARRSSPER